MAFPIHRPRRLRRTNGLRRMVRETEVTPDDLIAPLFICEGKGQRIPIPSMPGIDRVSVDEALKEAAEFQALQTPALLFFGVVPAHQKDETGKEAWSAEGLVQQAMRAIKEKFPDLVLIADTCLCEYTSHGHCGPLDAQQGVHNDQTLEHLGKTAVSQARSGADIIAPSGMMDGMVSAIRKALDSASFDQTAILSYSAKFTSAFYGPFRDAADSAPTFGDRRQYQMDPPNAREALRETLLDIEEGADMVMVKPALSYLDIISQVRRHTDLPVAAYNVSGEYSLVKAAAEKGWIEEARMVDEMLTSIKRAGADTIITYWAKDVAKRLN